VICCPIYVALRCDLLHVVARCYVVVFTHTRTLLLFTLLLLLLICLIYVARLLLLRLRCCCCWCICCCCWLRCVVVVVAFSVVVDLIAFPVGFAPFVVDCCYVWLLHTTVDLIALRCVAVDCVTIYGLRLLR